MPVRPGKADFILGKQNAEAYAEICRHLADPDQEANIAICGPRWTGKTSLLHELAHTLYDEDPSKEFVCTGADIGMSLVAGADESFLERLGSIPTLFVDDFDVLLNFEDGQQTAQLLLDERARLGLNTVLASRDHLPNGSDIDGALKESLKRFVTFWLDSLDSEERASLVRAYADLYRNDKSPKLLDEACEYIARIDGFNYRDMENAAHFLMSASGLAADAEIDQSNVRVLLQ